MLVIQDWALFLAHVCLIIFNMVGWIWPRTRVLHLVTMGLTSFSWFVLGAIHGWGYCVCMDYHAHILRQLNHPDAHVTFIQLVLKRLFGISASQPVADYLTVIVFALIVIATAAVWARDLCRRGIRVGGHGEL